MKHQYQINNQILNLKWKIWIKKCETEPWPIVVGVDNQNRTVGENGWEICNRNWLKPQSSSVGQHANFWASSS